jgi:uncharacterized protein
MLDMITLRELVLSLNYAPLFVTVSGAHLYGFPSPDSDVDLRGAHLLPLAKVIGLHEPNETHERKLDLRGQEVELVSHDLGKYLRLLVKNNGYVLEQIFSPLVVHGEEFLEELRPLARRCITKHHYHHYRGFIATKRKMLDKQESKEVKSLLYAYRVLLTGIHLLQTGEVEPHLPTLAQRFALPFLLELISRKRAEKITAPELDWAFHAQQLDALEQRMTEAFSQSSLAEDRDQDAVNQLLVRMRLGSV